MFHDIGETAVEVLAIVSKNEAQAWLDEQGAPEQGRGAGES
jgi:hypothetical protein